MVSALSNIGVKVGARGGAGFGVGIRQLAAMALASYTTGMGKGLSEPCPPYREAYVFGAELGAPDANSWNCTPDIMDPTTTFDLSAITPNHEVAIVMLLAFELPAGASYPVSHKWYRDRDNALLFEYSHTIPNPGDYGYISWGWYYVYSYIGYVPWEIWEDGDYHVDLAVTGRFSETLNFTVTGVAPVFEGSISRKELEYDGVRSGIPVL